LSFYGFKNLKTHTPAHEPKLGLRWWVRRVRTGSCKRNHLLMDNYGGWGVWLQL